MGGCNVGVEREFGVGVSVFVFVCVIVIIFRLTQPYLVISQLCFVSQASCIWPDLLTGSLVLSLFQQLVVVSNYLIFCRYQYFLKSFSFYF